MSSTFALFLVVVWLSISGSFESEPKPIFSSNVTSLELGKSAKLTCQVENFDPGNGEYVVNFYRDSEDWFCYYDISAPDSSGQRSTTLHNGLSYLRCQPFSSTFPVYEITITPTFAHTEEYYCGLYRFAPRVDVHSKHLSITVTPPPPPHFTSSKPSENQRVGTCTVGATGLDLRRKTYSVQFMSDLGPKSVNLLGEYIFRPNLSEEFKSNPLPPWTSLHHGPSTSWPEFSLLATGTGSLNGTWWCVLAVGAQGAPDYREFKSEKATL